MLVETQLVGICRLDLLLNHSSLTLELLQKILNHIQGVFKVQFYLEFEVRLEVLKKQSAILLQGVLLFEVFAWVYLDGGDSSAFELSIEFDHPLLVLRAYHQ